MPICAASCARGATVCIVGEPKSPDALRNASDQFFEWVRPETQAELTAETQPKSSAKAETAKSDPVKLEQAKPAAKRRPRFVVEAVALLAGDTSEGKVGLGALGQYLKRTDPAFSPKEYGHSGLLSMVKTYNLLTARQEEGGHWSVSLASKIDISDEAE